MDITKIDSGAIIIVKFVGNDPRFECLPMGATDEQVALLQKVIERFKKTVTDPS